MGLLAVMEVWNFCVKGSFLSLLSTVVMCGFVKLQ